MKNTNYEYTKVSGAELFQCLYKSYATRLNNFIKSSQKRNIILKNLNNLTATLKTRRLTNKIICNGPVKLNINNNLTEDKNLIKGT